MSGNNSTLSCSALAEMGGFEGYMKLIHNMTEFDIQKLGICQKEICSALFGVGNPDVSGIGVTIAYVIETGLGFVLSLCCYLLRRHITKSPWKRLKEKATRPTEKGLDTFFMSAIFFTASILIASNYSLAKRDFDISAEGFGVLESHLVSSVTVVSVLPLLYLITIGLADGNGEASSKDAAATGRDANETMAAGPDHPVQARSAVGRREARKKAYNEQLQKRYRLILLGLNLALFVYPFVSQCTHNWAPTDIGQGNGPGGTTIVETWEWKELIQTCFPSHNTSNPLSNVESTVIPVFQLTGSITYIIVTVWKFLFLLLAYMKIHTRKQLKFFTSFSYIRWLCKGLVFLGPLLLSIPLLWSIFRLRDLQRGLAEATQNTYPDNFWSFGQVMAIVIFIPVITDMFCCLLEV